VTLFSILPSCFQKLAYGNPLYRIALDRVRAPESLHLILNDTWPGNAETGQALMAGHGVLFDQEACENQAQRRYLLAHNWLRDLRAVGTESAKRKARSFLETWLRYHDGWRADSWAPETLGERLFNWISFYGFFADAPSPFADALIASMMRQWRHLSRLMPCPLSGVDHLLALKGFLAAGLSLSCDEKAFRFGIDLLRQQLFTEILLDGGHVTRNPLMQLHMLRHLIDVRSIFYAAQRDVPHELATALERMVPALKLFRHGDGGLALFNGSQEATALEIEAAVTLSDVRGRAQRRLPQMNYERIALGRSLLLVDVGAPPPSPFDEMAHAGLLSFEFSVGRERLIVNCGAGPDDDAAWRTALAATAAHSTLTLNDTNACDVLPAGGVSQRPSPILSQRFEQDGGHYIEASHTGYDRKFSVVHQRSLCLTAEGDELHGRDVLSGPPGHDVAVRWHLHPSVQASLAHGGHTVLLRLPSNTGWRLRIVDCAGLAGTLSLEPSVYCGRGAPRRSLQIRLSGRTREDPTVISWLLAKEKKS